MQSLFDIIKYIWRKYKSISLRQRNIIVSPSAYFNKQTLFEGNNVIHPYAVVSNSVVGRNTYVGKGSFMANCKIGRFCSIAPGVQVIAGNHPTTTFVSTCPSFYSNANQNGQFFVNSVKFKEKELI